MSFPGQLLQLQVIERRDSAGRTLSFLRLYNGADEALNGHWRLYFSLGLVPTEAETRVRRKIIDGRYGFLEPTADWASLGPGEDTEIPLQNWLFTHMPAVARQGFHLLTWEASPAEGTLSEPENLAPVLLDITSTPNTWIADMSPSCDIHPDTVEHRYKVNEEAVADGEFTIIPAPETFINLSAPIPFSGLDFDDDELAKVLPNNPAAGSLPVTVSYQDKLDSYSIDVNSSGITIKSASEESTFHAAHTLRQLINAENGLQPCQIIDRPDFEHRGLFIDIARHFHSVDDLKTIIQGMAAYKMNRLQLGISNDEGWRLAIPGLPELTNIGARRKFLTAESAPTDSLYPAWGDGPEEKHDYISGEQFVELLRFAEESHVEIIIEFNLPAHANALIKSIGASGRYRIVDPDDESSYRSAQGYSHNVVNVCLPDTFELARQILLAIADYYETAGLPVKHIHLGGDELPEGAWLGSPACHKSSLWLASWDMDNATDREAATRSLQEHYARRIIDIVQEIDPDIMIGFWHEMAPFLPADANTYITGWTTESAPDGLIDDILRRDQKLVVANASFLYLDMPYSLHAEEPGLPWAAYTSTRRIHDFNPLDCWAITDMSAVMGLQAQLWSETVIDQTALHYYLFPRLLAVAERSWRSRPGNWADFAAALGGRELAYLDTLKIDYRLPPPGIQITGDQLRGNTAYPGLTIRYNLGGANPTPNCPSLNGSLDISGYTEIRLATFSPSGERSSRVEIVEDLTDAGLD